MSRHGGDLRSLTCPVCGDRVLRPAHVRSCSRECANIGRRKKRSYECISCRREFSGVTFGSTTGRLCPECKVASGGQRLETRTCPVCGRIVTRQSRYRACSRSCGNRLAWGPRKRWPDRRSAMMGKMAARRMRMAGTDGTIMPINREVVARRDRYLCGICGDAVDMSVRHPDPRSPSVDHIHPLACGGEHTYVNVRLSHLGCNVRRGTRAV